MSLTERLSELVRACFTGLWIESHEHEDALAEVAMLCRSEEWRLATWDIEEGLKLQGQNPGADTGTNDPLAAIRALSAFAASDQPALFVLVNFHRFLQSGEIVQALAKQIAHGKQNRSFVVILSPIVQVPAELEKHFVVIEHDLPGREQLAEIARGIATEHDELPAPAEFDRVIDAAAGLTRYEAEGAFSLSLVRHGKLRADVLWEQKSQMLKKSGLISLHRGTETFADVGGLDALKAFCLRAMRRQGEANPLLRPRGVLLLSPPGCGKSAFAKSLGNETGRPTLTLEIGNLLGSLVGESERNMRQALRIVDAMAPCVLFADELEKGLAGVSGNAGDSGVASRIFGQLLTWLNDRTSDVFLVGTCNDISRLPPEFARAERFDAVTFIDLPDKSQRRKIWEMYIARFQLDSAQQIPTDDEWTGAEIRACCRLAALLDLPLNAAAQHVVPIARTAGEAIEKLRNWASGRCLSADRPGIFKCETSPRRKVSREPSQN
ncbi:AAA family ATPase [Anatilimnocola floriformis]|uniref:AAA family ATPase n=1 Tax=Anatilimnocola floriformis TaxID=2948575 RepID=UPI0020C32DC4|nr:AAA family ATPase [Anatilimnocola floriformis]